MDTRKALQNFGLNKNRAEVYMALLELKKASIGDLAKKTGVLRTTIYDNINFLKKINLASEIIEKGKTMFIPESPENLNNVLRLQEIELKNIMPILVEQFKTKKYEAKIKFYEGAEGVKKLHEESLINITEKTLYAMGDLNVLWDYVPKSYTQNFVKKRVAMKIENKILLSGSKEFYKDSGILTEIENIKALRQARIAPPGINLKMFIWVVGPKTMFFAPKEEGYCFVFESKSFSQTILTIFNALWSISTPYNS